MELQEAMKVGAVQGVFAGTGGSSGDSITLSAKGALKVELCPEFHPGLALQNANASAQNMVLASLRGIPQRPYIRPVTELRFEPDIETEYIFEAYCLNFHKDNPSDSDRLSLAGSAPEAVRKVLAVSSSDIKVKAMQLAVWALTDNITSHDAQDRFDATESDIANARQIVQAAGLEPGQYHLFAGAQR